MGWPGQAAFSLTCGSNSKRACNEACTTRMTTRINILVRTWARGNNTWRAVLTCIGLSLRELIREFKWQTLVLFKCCLLQPKVLDRICLRALPLTGSDAIFWVPLRTPMHDAVFVDFFDTGPHTKPGGLCRSRAGQL